MAKPHMNPLMIEYLVAACEETQGDLDKQVETVKLRKRLHFSPEEDQNAQRGLEFRGYITTKGAGRVGSPPALRERRAQEEDVQDHQSIGGSGDRCGGVSGSRVAYANGGG